MTAALRAELLKLRTTKTFLGVVAAMVGLVSLVTVLHALGMGAANLSGRADQLRIMTEGGELPAAIFAGLLGAMAFTGEIRHGTIRPTLLSIPQRGRVIAAKAVTSVAAGLVLGLAATALAAAIATAAISARGVSVALGAVDYTRLILGGAAAAAAWAGIGLGVGALVRNQVAAIVGIFVWLLFVENILVDSAPSVSRYMPGVLGRAIIGQQAGALHSPWLAVLLLALYTAALVAAGWRTVLRLDFA